MRRELEQSWAEEEVKYLAEIEAEAAVSDGSALCEDAVEHIDTTVEAAGPMTLNSQSTPQLQSFGEEMLALTNLSELARIRASEELDRDFGPKREPFAPLGNKPQSSALSLKKTKDFRKFETLPWSRIWARRNPMA